MTHLWRTYKINYSAIFIAKYSKKRALIRVKAFLCKKDERGVFAIDNLLSSPVTIAVSIVIAIIVGMIIGVTYRKKVGEAAIGSAEEEARRIINEAIKTSESKKREALLEAKEENHKLKTEMENELRERRTEVQRQERRIQQKEENIDKKTETLESKEESLNKKLREAATVRQETEKVKDEQLLKLEQISGFTAEEAKVYLLSSIESEIRHETAVKIKEMENKMREEADGKAREIISLAIQKCAAEHVAEATV